MKEPMPWPTEVLLSLARVCEMFIVLSLSTPDTGTRGWMSVTFAALDLAILVFEQKRAPERKVAGSALEKTSQATLHGRSRNKAQGMDKQALRARFWGRATGF